MLERQFYIYLIKNLINNKIYVGRTLDIKKRFILHKSRAKTLKTSSAIHHALFKYGIENFTFEIIESQISKYKVDEREKYWIKNYNSYGPMGYNLTEGGGGTEGYHHTDETKNKISQSHMGEKHYLYNKNISQETKIKMSKSVTEYQLSNSKLTKEDIIQIKTLLKDGKLKNIEIAKLFNTTAVNISKIRHNKLWNNL